MDAMREWLQKHVDFEQLATLSAEVLACLAANFDHLQEPVFTVDTKAPPRQQQHHQFSMSPMTPIVDPFTDDYDPAKPEYVATATEEEVEQAAAELLAKQIAKLEAHTALRRASEPELVGHYEEVLSTMRTQAASNGRWRAQTSPALSHRRMRSEPHTMPLEFQARPRDRAHTDGLVLRFEDAVQPHEDDEQESEASPSSSPERPPHSRVLAATLEEEEEDSEDDLPAPAADEDQPGARLLPSFGPCWCMRPGCTVSTPASRDDETSSQTWLTPFKPGCDPHATAQDVRSPSSLTTQDTSSLLVHKTWVMVDTVPLEISML